MATLAKNTIFKVGTTAVTGVTSIAWSGITWKTEDTTNHDSATPVETLQTTVYSNGKYSVILDYDVNNTQHTALRTLSTSGASQSFIVIQVNSGETQTFDGYVTSFSFDTPVNGLLKAKIDVTCAGAITLS